jgi:putative ABC transport system permease protein
MDMFSLVDVGLASLLVVIAIGLSYYERLGVERDLVVASVRAFAQLMAVGYVLNALLTVDRIIYVLLMITVMILVGAYTASERENKIPGAFLIAVTAIGVGVFLTLGMVLAMGIIAIKARYVIPIASVIIAQAMTGTALAFNRLRGEFTAQQAQIEVALALGATSRQAANAPLKAAIRAALIPTIQRAKTVGLVSLPGSMSGMILAGVTPLDAVKYQALIEYIVIGSSAITTFAAALLAYRRFFTSQHQLLRAPLS